MYSFCGMQLLCDQICVNTEQTYRNNVIMMMMIMKILMDEEEQFVNVNGGDNDDDEEKEEDKEDDHCTVVGFLLIQPFLLQEPCQVMMMGKRSPHKSSQYCRNQE